MTRENRWEGIRYELNLPANKPPLSGYVLGKKTNKISDAKSHGECAASI